ncbi:MAG TPA: hypothetical protein VE053_09415 [Allosphingosinicella sp.]|nr:hypothetical protein [Allosphingosinicella sp.]
MSGCRAAVLAALFLANTPAGAAAQPISAVSELVLNRGTRVSMQTVQPLSSKRALQGQRFDLEVSEEVRVNGMLVIPKGARGVGEVSRVVEKGMMGKAGKLEVRVMYVEVGGTRIRLDGKARDKGASGAAGVVLAAPLIGLTGAAFVKGKSAVIPAGSNIEGFVYQDVPLTRPAI